MKITVAQQCDGSNGWQPLRDLTWPVTRSYCSRSRYQIFQKESVDTRGWNAAWGKIPTILEAFRRGAHYVLWMDTDACIMTPHVRVEDILRGRERFSLIVSTDANGINCGVYIWKRSLWSLRLLNRIWTEGPVPTDIWHEQSALMRTIGTRGELEPRHVCIVPKRTLNSYFTAPWLPYQGDYVPGDFILHAPGVLVPDKLRIFSEASPQP